MRQYATIALSSCVGYDNEGELVWDPDMVEALIERCDDESSEVRDWAIMGLGTQLQDFNSPRIRDVLFSHINETEGDIAGEAAVGLALRRDSRVLPILLAELAKPDVGNLYVEAAAGIGDQRLLPLLRALKENDWTLDEPRPQVLANAMAACSRRA